MRPEARSFEAMGTACSLLAVGASPDRLEVGERWVRDLSARLTRFSSRSELSRLNATAGEWVDVSLEMEEILVAALRAHEMSLGLVNAGVLDCVLATGYTRPMGEGPTAATLEQVRPPAPLGDVLWVRRGQARLKRGSGIDLGGIAKGWMADRLSDIIGPNVVVNLGGDLRAAGPGPDGGGWPVAMGSTTLMLRDRGAATSSVRRRRWGDVHHLIDPRTGLPADTGLDEVSVVAGSGFDAEVVAKTALLLGPGLAPAYCAANALAWRLVGPE